MAEGDKQVEVVVDPMKEVTSQTNPYSEEVIGVATSIEKRALHSDTKSFGALETSSTIVRVYHPTVKKNGDVEPQFITIGPLHRLAKPELIREDVKGKYLQSLLPRANPKTLEDFVKQVTKLEQNARKPYPPEEVSELSKEKFVEMMVVDGCFVVEYLIRHYRGERQEEIIHRYEHLLKKDLVRLENQIPFCVLKSIFQSCWVGSDLDLTTIALYLLAPRGRVIKTNHTTVHHLLHLLHLCLDDFSGHLKDRKCLLLHFFNLIFHPFYCILYLLVHGFVSDTKSNDYKNSKPSGGVPNATYLRENGFKFILNSGARSFLDVRIRGTTVQIPKLNIGTENLSLLSNLLTWEKCCAVSGKHVTRYATFMCHLIRTHEDVAILQQGGIITKFPGSSKTVLGYFQNRCRGERLDGEDENYLINLVMNIDTYFNENYRKVQLYRWRKKFIPDYFSNPWAVPSMIAAFILLLLTVVQTFFAVYSYYRPPS